MTSYGRVHVAHRDSLPSKSGGMVAPPRLARQGAAWACSAAPTGRRIVPPATAEERPLCPACAVKMHVNMSQEPFYTEIYRKNATPSWSILIKHRPLHLELLSVDTLVREKGIGKKEGFLSVTRIYEFPIPIWYFLLLFQARKNGRSAINSGG